MADTARVFILYTGGTIGMAPEDSRQAGSSLVPMPLDDLLRYVPGLEETGIALSYDAFDPPMDSSDFGPDDWVRIAKRIESVYDEFDGFVVLHGTDTLAYTASALAFCFENLAKPVVLTGSQLPISEIRTDAKMNFVNSIFLAGHAANSLPCIPEVVIVFGDKVLRGCCARKVSSTRWAGFDSPNRPPLGEIGEHIVIDTMAIRPMPSPEQRFHVNTDLATRVIDVSLFPGFQTTHLEQILALQDVDAVVLRTYGAGNAPNASAFLRVIEKARQNNKTIVNVTQCHQGMVEMGRYEASSGLLERGVISGLDITPEAALTKLMWTLGTKIGDQIATQMQVNQRGEQTENLFDLRFGACGTGDNPEVSFCGFRTPDRRLVLSQLKRAVLRISGLQFPDHPHGDSVDVRVFMNLSSANSQTSTDHEKCVSRFSIVWTGSPIHQTIQLSNERVASALGAGDVMLSVVTDSAVRFCFDGMYLALFARS